MTEMQAKIPFQAKVREVGHVGAGGPVSGFRFQSFRGLGARFQVSGFKFQVPRYFVPLSQGAKRVFRGMTECHSVPSEGSTPQCDVGQSNAPEGVCFPVPRSPLFFTYPLRFARPPNLEGQSGGDDKRKTEM